MWLTVFSKIACYAMSIVAGGYYRIGDSGKFGRGDDGLEGWQGLRGDGAEY